MEWEGVMMSWWSDALRQSEMEMRVFVVSVCVSVREDIRTKQSLLLIIEEEAEEEEGGCVNRSNPDEEEMFVSEI